MAVALVSVLTSSGAAAAGPECMRYTVSAGDSRCLWLRESAGGKKIACKKDSSIVHGPGIERGGWTMLYRGPASAGEYVWVNSQYLVGAEPVERC